MNKELLLIMFQILSKEPYNKGLNLIHESLLHYTKCEDVDCGNCLVARGCHKTRTTLHLKLNILQNTIEILINEP